jgi:hypothetical protein
MTTSGHRFPFHAISLLGIASLFIDTHLPFKVKQGDMTHGDFMLEN